MKITMVADLQVTAMDLLEDMLKALDRVEIWKQLQGTPQRISELEKGVAELEGKIGGRWPADVCKTVHPQFRPRHHLARLLVLGYSGRDPLPAHAGDD
jgi:hypothetical protein